MTLKERILEVLHNEEEVFIGSTGEFRREHIPDASQPSLSVAMKQLAEDGAINALYVKDKRGYDCFVAATTRQPNFDTTYLRAINHCNRTDNKMGQVPVENIAGVTPSGNDKGVYHVVVRSPKEQTDWLRSQNAPAVEPAPAVDAEEGATWDRVVLTEAGIRVVKQLGAVEKSPEEKAVDKLLDLISDIEDAMCAKEDELDVLRETLEELESALSTLQDLTNETAA